MRLIPQNSLSIIYVDSQETGAEDGKAVNILDGNPNTYWHTEWSVNEPGHPHEVQIDLGNIYSVGGFRYLPRQNIGYGGENGDIKDFEFYVSNDVTNWGSPVATGTFLRSKAEQQVTFSKKQGRYIKLVALSEINGNPWTSAAELNVLEVIDPLIPQNNLSIIYVDSQETTAEDGKAVNILDGNPNTYWHTEWSVNEPGHPHEVQIDLGNIYSVGGFRYLPRQNIGYGGENGDIKDFEFYVSNDVTNWGSPVATGTFLRSKAEQQVTFSKKQGRYIKLVALSEINGNPWTSAAELNVLEVIDPCERVVCDDICIGTDRFSQKCVDGKCITNTLIEGKSSQCGYIFGDISFDKTKYIVTDTIIISWSHFSEINGTINLILPDGSYIPYDINSESGTISFNTGLRPSTGAWRAVLKDDNNVQHDIVGTQVHAADPCAGVSPNWICEMADNENTGWKIDQNECYEKEYDAGTCPLPSTVETYDAITPEEAVTRAAAGLSSYIKFWIPVLSLLPGVLWYPGMWVPFGFIITKKP